MSVINFLTTCLYCLTLGFCKAGLRFDICLHQMCLWRLKNNFRLTFLSFNKSKNQGCIEAFAIKVNGPFFWRGYKQKYEALCCDVCIILAPELTIYGHFRFLCWHDNNVCKVGCNFIMKKLLSVFFSPVYTVGVWE